MRNFLYLFIAIISFITMSCKSKTAFTDYSANSKLDNALLWKIEGNGINSPSYLFGTIHLIPKDDFFLPEGTEQALNSVSDVYFEIDMNQMNDPSVIMGMMSKIMMSNGETLKGLLSDEDYKIVANHFEKMGLPLMLFERMKPMFLTAFGGDINPINGNTTSYEMEILNKIGDKNTGGLETLEFQLELFDEIPYEDQAKMLVEGIKSKENGNDQLQKMIEIYKSQNIEELSNMINDPNSGLGDHDDILLSKRNKNWIPIIEKIIKNNSSFFAVGAGHLPGKEGVIKLLRKQGYKVSPVNPKK